MHTAHDGIWASVFDPTQHPWLPNPSTGLSLENILALSPLNETDVAQHIARFLGLSLISLAKTPMYHSSNSSKNGVFIADNLMGISDPTQLLSTLSKYHAFKEKPLRLVCLSHTERLRFLYKQRSLSWQKRLDKKETALVNLPDLARFCCDYAYHMRASDLQLLPQGKHHRLTLRIDGIRQSLLSIPAALSIRLARHWLLQAQLSYTQKQPQDGTLSILINTHTKRLRLHACPTDKGMSISIRLPRSTQHYELSDLQLEPTQRKQLMQSLSQSHGLIFVTGPTGSGKTQTLYCCLRHLAHEGRHVISLEDPVEQELPHITQIPVRANTDLGYAEAMTHALRQDPDVIMIGEVRDRETAAMALQAAQTGHLVLASCHSSHTLATCDRLKQLGLDLRELNHIPTTLLAQRLVRSYCTFCFKQKKQSCLHCDSGYQGRRAIFECLPLSSSLIQVLSSHDMTQINRIAKKQSVLWLGDHAKLLIQQRITSLDECQRVLGRLMESNQHDS